MTPTVSNVLSVYRAADADSLREGLSWYQDAHNFCVRQARGNERLVKRNAGIVAALSPMNEWENNKRKAMEVISRRARIVFSEDGSNGIGLGNNVRKAMDIYRGADPLDVLKGDKVRAFYRTFLDPNGDVEPVVDRHAFDIAVGRRTDDRTRSMLQRKGVYEEFASIYREAARQVGIGAPQMQAVTWVAWKRMHGIAI